MGARASAAGERLAAAPQHRRQSVRGCTAPVSALRSGEAARRDATAYRGQRRTATRARFAGMSGTMENLICLECIGDVGAVSLTRTALCTMHLGLSGQRLSSREPATLPRRRSGVPCKSLGQRGAFQAEMVVQVGMDEANFCSVFIRQDLVIARSRRRNGRCEFSTGCWPSAPPPASHGCRARPWQRRSCAAHRW